VADARRLELTCAAANTGKAVGLEIPTVVFDLSIGGDDLTTFTELGQTEFSGEIEDGVIEVTQGSTRTRVYQIRTTISQAQAAALNYLRILQESGDPGDGIDQQQGLIILSDYYQRSDRGVDLINLRTEIAGTAETIGVREMVFAQMPCYLIFDQDLRGFLGTVRGEGDPYLAERVELTIIERPNLLPGESATQQLGSIRLSYGGFVVDLTIFDDPYIREPNQSPSVSYSTLEVPAIEGYIQGTYKQRWPIVDTELTDTQIEDLDSLLASWRQNGGNILLTDLTRRLSQPAPATRAIAPGTVSETVSGIIRYYPVANVAQDGPLVVKKKDGDSSKKLVSITLSELRDSA